MDNKVIETCLNCKCYGMSLEKKKNEKFAHLYLKVCYNCPYKMEFMVLSGNSETKLPLEISNVYQIIDKIKSGKVYGIQKTNAKINVLIDLDHRKISNSEKFGLIFDFIKFLSWSDKLKPLMEKLKTEMSYEFKNVLIDKRKGV